jgi:hypothetical protein
MGPVIRCFIAEASDYQPITNPAYPVDDADREPVSILSGSAGRHHEFETEPHP